MATDSGRFEQYMDLAHKSGVLDVVSRQLHNPRQRSQAWAGAKRGAAIGMGAAAISPFAMHAIDRTVGTVPFLRQYGWKKGLQQARNHLKPHTTMLGEYAGMVAPYAPKIIGGAAAAGGLYGLMKRSAAKRAAKAKAKGRRGMKESIDVGYSLSPKQKSIVDKIRKQLLARKDAALRGKYIPKIAKGVTMRQSTEGVFANLLEAQKPDFFTRLGRAQKRVYHLPRGGAADPRTVGRMEKLRKLAERPGTPAEGAAARSRLEAMKAKAERMGNRREKHLNRLAGIDRKAREEIRAAKKSAYRKSLAKKVGVGALAAGIGYKATSPQTRAGALKGALVGLVVGAIRDKQYGRSALVGALAGGAASKVSQMRNKESASPERKRHQKFQKFNQEASRVGKRLLPTVGAVYGGLITGAQLPKTRGVIDSAGAGQRSHSARKMANEFSYRMDAELRAMFGHRPDPAGPAYAGSVRRHTLNAAKDLPRSGRAAAAKLAATKTKAHGASQVRGLLKSERARRVARGALVGGVAGYGAHKLASYIRNRAENRLKQAADAADSRNKGARRT